MREAKLVSHRIAWLDDVLTTRTCVLLSPCRAEIGDASEYRSYEEWYEKYYSASVRLNNRVASYWAEEKHPCEATRLRGGWKEDLPDGQILTVEEQSWFAASHQDLPYGEYDENLFEITLKLAAYYKQKSIILSYPVDKARFLARFWTNVPGTDDYRTDDEWVFTSWKELETLVGEEYWSTFYDRPEGDPKGFKFTAMANFPVAPPPGWWNVSRMVNEEIRTGILSPHPLAQGWRRLIRR